MGKPYASELNRFPATYELAIKTKNDPLREAIQEARDKPLIALASGGALAAAHSLCYLHRTYTSRPASATTPFLFSTSSPTYQDQSIWLISASGRNEDILRAFDLAVSQEPRQLVVICGNERSPLAVRTLVFPWVRRIILPALGRKDGFLATNSLLTFIVTLSNHYSHQFGGDSLPHTFAELIDREPHSANPMDDGDKRAARDILNRESTIVLHGNIDHTAAIDLESRFSEAAIGNIQLTDYRNFGHGRHNWLTQRGDSTSILAFLSDDTVQLADKTLSLLPKTIPIYRLDCRPGPIAGHVRAIVRGIALAGAIAYERGIDPGRPKVPTYGRKLYHLGIPRPARAQRPLSRSDEELIIRRKYGTDNTIPQISQRYMTSREGLRRFLKSMANTKFEGCVFDYDGTLVDQLDRFHPPRAAITEQLLRLLHAGIPLGIASGRGDSLGRDLQSVLPRSYWPRVLVGYLNGAVVAPLSKIPNLDGKPRVQSELGVLYKSICDDHRISASGAIKSYATQISVRPTTGNSFESISQIISETIFRRNLDSLRLLRSGHSVDVILRKTSKSDVVKRYARKYSLRLTSIVSIADNGRWPGNDSDLLSLPHALSVDLCGLDDHTGWNIGPVGCRGTIATVAYLQALQLKRQAKKPYMKFDMEVVNE